MHINIELLNNGLPSKIVRAKRCEQQSFAFILRRRNLKIWLCVNMNRKASSIQSSGHFYGRAHPRRGKLCISSSMGNECVHTMEIRKPTSIFLIPENHFHAMNLLMQFKTFIVSNVRVYVNNFRWTNNFRAYSLTHAHILNSTCIFWLQESVYIHVQQSFAVGTAKNICECKTKNLTEKLMPIIHFGKMFLSCPSTKTTATTIYEINKTVKNAVLHCNMK